MSTARAITILLLALLAGACSDSAPDGGGRDSSRPAAGAGDRPDAAQPPGPPESGRLTVETADPEAVDARHVAGDRAYGLPSTQGPERLAAPVNTAFVGNLSPGASLAPERQALLAYNAFRGGRPVVHLRDVATDEDRVLAAGAYSLAWRPDGAIAYFQRRDPTARSPKSPGHVVVERRPGAPATRWTAKPGRYVVAAWAGDRLLVYRIARSWPQLLVLDGRRRVRVLGPRTALIALSPDGTRAFVSRYGAATPLVRILDVARGAELARLTLAGDGKAGGVPGVEGIGESGAWARDLVVAPASSGLVVFRVGAREVAVEQVLELDPNLFPTSFAQPRLDATGRTITATAQLTQAPRAAVPLAAVLECDRVALRCRQGRSAPLPEGARLIYDPSRPAPSGP
jgi:hypothetical protein